MISNIDPIKSALASIVSAVAGTCSKYFVAMAPAAIENANTAFQHAAWSVAILAGLVSIWNGVATAISRYKKNHPKKAGQ